MWRALSALRALWFACVIGLVGLPLAACSDEGHAVLHTSMGDFTFRVELADTDQARARGLMFRTELAPDAGMLFDFREEVPVSFWMQNTLIPLDMVFISAGGIVRGIHANARPMDTTAIPSPGPVRFVLEIAGGRAAEIGLMPGDRLAYPRVEAAE